MKIVIGEELRTCNGLEIELTDGTKLFLHESCPRGSKIGTAYALDIHETMAQELMVCPRAANHVLIERVKR